MSKIDWAALHARAVEMMGLEVGDEVRVIRRMNSGDYGISAFYDFNSFNLHVLETGIVKSIWKDLVSISFKKGWVCAAPIFVLELVEKGKKEPKHVLKNYLDVDKNAPVQVNFSHYLGNAMPQNGAIHSVTASMSFEALEQLYFAEAKKRGVKTLEDAQNLIRKTNSEILDALDELTGFSEGYRDSLRLGFS